MIILEGMRNRKMVQHFVVSKLTPQDLVVFCFETRYSVWPQRRSKFVPSCRDRYLVYVHPEAKIRSMSPGSPHRDQRILPSRHSFAISLPTTLLQAAEDFDEVSCQRGITFPSDGVAASMEFIPRSLRASGRPRLITRMALARQIR